LTFNQLDLRKVLAKWGYVMWDIPASGVFGICVLEPEAKLRVMAGQAERRALLGDAFPSLRAHWHI
jgi:hypothetical protein